ncbi:endonuclease/exonuclease/phosphatase family protein [Methylomarinum vadi]|uniref:endonuclease/exonuclease/phosphatase family protein n=1 Tax=Methylomarinum vadi TaxID=438855 RepID=UPI0004DF0BD9|nr:endonuclease/exonuclease/phosphatase family protein [Methylomarinum vadi]
MELSLLTLNLHTYQQHPRHCPFDTMHQHEREAQIIAEAIAHLEIDVICFQEVGEYLHDPVTRPYGESPSNMAFRVCNKLRHWGIWYHIHQDWSHIGFYRWREGTAILSRYPMRHNYSAYVSMDRRKDNYMSRNVTMSCIDVPWFGLLHVANVHLSWGHHGFFEEYWNLRNLIESRRHFGIRADLIVGDFNAPAGEQAYNHIVGNGDYVDQFHELHPHRFYEPSYRGQIDGWINHPPKRIDYIFKGNGQPIRVKTMDSIFNDGFFPVVSDHFGYFARFELY